MFRKRELCKYGICGLVALSLATLWTWITLWGDLDSDLRDTITAMSQTRLARAVTHASRELEGKWCGSEPIEEQTNCNPFCYLTPLSLVRQFFIIYHDCRGAGTVNELAKALRSAAEKERCLEPNPTPH